MEEIKKKRERSIDKENTKGKIQGQSPAGIYQGIAALVILALIITGFLLFKKTAIYRDMVAIFSSQESFRQYISGFEGKASIVFFLLQVVQVIVSPIPGAVTTVAGGSLFGLTQGFLLNSISILLGSMLAYFLAKKFGKTLVIRLVGEDKFNKYYRSFTRKFSIALLLIFLLPFFPDDLFCFLAGLSLLPFRAYFLLLIFGRLPVIFVQTLLGTQVFNLGPVEWIIFIAVIGILTYVLIKQKDKLVEILEKDN